MEMCSKVRLVEESMNCFASRPSAIRYQTRGLKEKHGMMVRRSGAGPRDFCSRTRAESVPLGTVRTNQTEAGGEKQRVYIKGYKFNYAGRPPQSLTTGDQIQAGGVTMT